MALRGEGVGTYGFLASGGEMGALMRAHDWTKTALGAPDTWPQSLRTAVRLLLNTGHPLYIFWGSDSTCLYNDAYRQSIGSERHPGSLGRPAREVWDEVWEVVGSQIAQVMGGRGATWHENQLVPITRNGVREDVYWTNGYCPIDDAAAPHGVGGVLVVVTETTEQVLAARRLADSEERLQLALGAGKGIGIWDWDVVNDRVVADERFARLYGVDPELAKAGAPIAAFFGAMHPEDHDRVRDRIGIALKTGADFVEEYRLVQPDGSVRWVSAQGRCILGKDGASLRFPGASFDVTEAYQIRDALKASEARFKAAVEAVQGVVWTNTAEGRMAGLQPGWSALTGQQPTEYEGFGWADAVHPDDAQPTIDAWHVALAARKTFVFEHRVRRADGVWRTFAIRAVPTIDADGKISEWVGVHTDVTAERQVQARLKELNAALAQRVQERTLERDRAWKSSQDLQVVVGTDGVFRETNAAWSTILGWQTDEVVGKNHLEFIHPDDHAASDGALPLALRGDLPSLENRYRHRDGTYRWISWLTAHDGDLVYASGRDVTAEKEQAEVLAKTEDALRQSQKMEAVGQLTGGIAHDFNNLLTGISGSLQMLETRVGQGRLEAIGRYLDAAQGAVRRAAALTQRLLAFSRRQTLDSKPTDANRLVAGLADLIRRTVGPAIEVEVVGAGGLWTILVDAHQLENALLNLCINARDAMPDGGRLTIETANKWLDDIAARERDLPPGQYVSLCVTDTGTGMPQEVIDRAFDPFFTTKPMGQGTGLGLSMIYGFVRQSNGQIRIYSEVGHGTTMCLYLPRHFGPADADIPTAPATAYDGGHGETVLVVDDEPTVRMLVVDLLEEAGYRPIQAADGAAGLAILQSDVRIDLLVTDVGLPGGINGRQMADAARVFRPALKVLFITGYAENAVIGNGHLDPGMHVITKPFSIDALGNKIRTMIDS